MPSKNTKPTKIIQIGRNFDKYDLDRVGYFHDPCPATFDEYQKPITEFRPGVMKGRQLTPGPTIKLFEDKFSRIFEGEGLPSTGRNDSQLLHKKNGKNVSGPPLLPPSPSKWHSTLGDWYGCFDKPFYLGPEQPDHGGKKEKKERELPNCKIKPNPLGGPGYANICFSPFPLHLPSPYQPEDIDKTKSGTGKFLSTSAASDHFAPNPYKEENPGPTYVRPLEKIFPIVGQKAFYIPFPKEKGGSQGGCFHKFPEYLIDSYHDNTAKRITSEPRFLSGGPTFKSKYTNSIINQVTKISCNAKNYKDYQQSVYPLVE